MAKFISKMRLQKFRLMQLLIKSIKTKSHNFKFFKMGLMYEEENRGYKNNLNSLIKKTKNQ